MIKPMKRRVLYAEKYHRYRNVVMHDQLSAIVDDMSAAYVDEQGTVELPTLDGQERQFVVVRIERIIRKEAPAAPHGADTQEKA
jgi:hypothetical protein